MTASIAHDFNNLLSVIIVCADEIAEASGPLERDRAREIRSAAERGAELSRRLLDGGGPAPVPPEPLPVDVALIDSLPLIRRTLAPSTEVRLTSDGNLPHVCLAPGELQRMLVNLAANSRDAMPPGGRVAIRSELVTIPPGDQRLPTGWCVRISFADSGAGMAPDVAARAIHPHFSTKPGGCGLGLATVHALARSRGGDLRIGSRPDAGTTVAIYLPAARPDGQSLALAGAGAGAS